MEHPCAKCGATIEDGIAFCPNCRAPQIRVLTPEFPTLHPGWQDSNLPPQAKSHLSPTSVSWPHALPASVLGGLIAFLAVFVPFAAFGPAYLMGGALAFLYYQSRTHSVPRPAVGASGVISSLITAALFFAIYSYHPDALHKALNQVISQMAERGYDPQAIQNATDMLNKPDGLASFAIFLVATMVIFFVAGCSIGGALCGVYLRKRMRS